MGAVSGFKAAVAGVAALFIAACADPNEEWNQAIDRSVSQMRTKHTTADPGLKEGMGQEILNAYVTYVFLHDGLRSHPESLTAGAELRFVVMDPDKLQYKPNVEIGINSQTGEMIVFLNPGQADHFVVYDAAQALYQVRLEQKGLEEYIREHSLMNPDDAVHAWLNMYGNGELGLDAALGKLALQKIREALAAHEIGKINERTPDGEAVPGLVKN